MRRPVIDPEDEMVCLGHGEDVAAQGGALAPPIVQTSLFAQPDLGTLHRGLAQEFHHAVYSRGRNPTVRAVEEKVARLERTAEAKAFASGMGAVGATLGALCAAGDHVLFVNQTYGPTLQLARRLARQGVEHDVVLDLDVESIAARMRPSTRIVWIESPGTMLFRVCDLGGHSDLVAGVLAGPETLVTRVFREGYLLQGASLAPFDAFLLNRGLRTLPLRMRRHHESGLAVARSLAERPRVRRVFHPGLGDGDAPATLGGFSGLFSVELDTEDAAVVARFVDALRLFRIGVSWGGVESIVIAPFRGDNAASLAAHGIPRGLVRLSIGLEPPELLVDDLDAALRAAFP